MPIAAGSRYVAMGSSFAARRRIPSRVPGSPRRAGRSTGNYAHHVARALGLDLHDVTYSGATTSDILHRSAAGQPAQLDAVTPATRLVTITAGGNDVGYLPRLTLASLPGRCGPCPPRRPGPTASPTGRSPTSGSASWPETSRRSGGGCASAPRTARCSPWTT
jgi:lysophospholipase L1-like esterase